MEPQGQRPDAGPGGPGDGRAGRRGPRRRGRATIPALVLIVVLGAVAVAAAFLVARAAEEPANQGPHGPYVIGAWTFGDDAAALERAADAGALDEVSLDWLQSRADGSVAAPRFDAAFLDLAKDKGRTVTVTLTDYDETAGTFVPAIAKAVLATPATRRRHAEAVAAWCRTYEVDGVDLDWEAIAASDRDGFTAFARQLKKRLHEDGRTLAVDVVPKLYEPGGWSTPQAQDWKDLGRIADEVRVMTYNYSGSWSGPGPLSPPGWMDAVLTFAESQIPARKIVMGLGFYGRDWRGAQTTDLVWNDVREVKATYTPRTFRGPTEELTLTYDADGHGHTAFFPDTRAVDAKVRMMLRAHPRIRGVYCWMLGQEQPSVWALLRKRLR
jgi:spore germination protein